MLPEIFRPIEQELTAEIKRSDSPFLGLFSIYLKDTTRKNLINLINDSDYPFHRYLENLAFYPALLSTLLIYIILEDFGKHGYFEIYPIFRKVFDEDLTQSQKTRLWRSFRRACLSLDLSISPRTFGPHFMVEEYLRQTGLPFRYVGKFAEKAIKFAEQVGIPDIDDPDSLLLWQNGLLDRMNSPFPKVARDAIKRDYGTYYVQQFIKIYSNPEGTTGNLSRLEKEILKTITEGPIKVTLKRAAIPQIVFRDIEYGVLLPSGDRIEWTLQIQNEHYTYSSNLEERFIPFEEKLPRSVYISNELGATWQYNLWEDRKNNRFLIFSMPAGKLVRSSSLTDKEIFLDPGDYLLLLRFMPDGIDNLEIFSEEPGIYLKNLSVKPGDTFSLNRGPAKIDLKINQIPFINFLSQPFRGIRGNEFFSAKNLLFEATIPLELLDAGNDFYLAIKCPTLGDDILINLVDQKETTIQFNFGELVSHWKKGVARLLIELYRKDSKRPLARKSAIIWNGLDSIGKRVLFNCEQLPANLNLDACENLKIDSSQNLLTYKDDANRFYKMAFNDGHRRLYFTWAVPGIFLSLISHTHHGELQRSLRIGETISVISTSREVLNIFATESANLQIGDFNISVDFPRIGSKKIPLASLIEYLRPGHNSLDFESIESGAIVKLINIVSPFEVLNYETISNMGFREIRFEVADEIQSLRLTVENLIDGSTYYTEFITDMTFGDLHGEIVPGVRCKLFMTKNNSCSIYFSLHNWPSGFWIVHLEIKANGRWGKLTNVMGELYADGVLVSNRESIKNFDEAYWEFEENLDFSEIHEIFGRIHKSLLISYAKEAWSNLFWIEKFWVKIINRLLVKNCDNNNWCDLLKISTERQQDSCLEFRFPSHHLGAVITQIYCLDKICYQFKSDGRNCLLGCLNFYPKLFNLVDVFVQNDLDYAILFSFSNVMEVTNQKKPPNDFSIAKYKEALKSRDLPDRWRLLQDDQWVPGRGDFLGPMHYRYALSNFKDAFMSSKDSKPGRLAEALYFVKKFNSYSIRPYVVNKRFKNFFKHPDLGLFEDYKNNCTILDEEYLTDQEHQLDIIQSLSFFSKICRYEARNPGILEQLSSGIKEECGYSPKDLNKSIGFLLSVGEDLFAFYLLLWELVLTADYDQNRRVYVRS